MSSSKIDPPTPRRAAHAAGLIALGVCSILAAPATGQELTLRVNDSVAPPGGTVALVLRTYASRPVGQGQICLRARRNQRGVAPPLFEAFLGGKVFSSTGDEIADFTADLVSATQTVLASFSSASAGINDVDGPLAVFYLQLDPDVAPGSEYLIEVDPGPTFLVDDAGQPIPLDPRPGRLRIRDPAAPRTLSVSGDAVPPGAVAEVAASTSEVFAIASGQVGFRYDPGLLAAEPEVVMDPRYGNASFVAHHYASGLSLISFESPDESLNGYNGVDNGVPGDFLLLRIPTAPDLLPGQVVPITLDPVLTFLLDPGAQLVPLTLEDDAVTLLGGEPIFLDGFEDGDLSAWTVP